jgi:hypothetical protein
MANARPVHSKPEPEVPAVESKQEKPVEQPKVAAVKPRIYPMPSGSICQDF